METAVVVVVVVEVLIGVLSILGNGLILYVIVRHQALHSKTNCLIGSLSLADFLVGVVGVPCVIVNLFGLPADFYGCLAMSSSIVLLTQVSIFNMLCIALERFVAVKFPSKYRQSSAFRAVIAAIVISWMAGILVGLVPMFGWNTGERPLESCTFLDVIDLDYMVYFNFFGCVLIPMVLTYMTYGYIFYFIRKQAKSRPGAPTPVSQTSQLPPTPQSPRSLTRETRAVKLIFTIIVAFAICWIPIHINNCVWLFADVKDRYVEMVFIFMSHANSAINPFIYAHGNRKFRTAMLTFLCPARNKLDTNNLELASSVGPDRTGDRTLDRV